MPMKKTFLLTITLLLVLALLGSSACIAAAQDPDTDYIPVHTKEELTALFGQVKEYLDLHGEELQNQLQDTEQQVVTSALIRSWTITQYDDATPQQIDDAYDALYNMFLFVGLITDPETSLSTGILFQYAVQLLDQEYFDLMKAADEDPEYIDFAEYLRDISEALVADPESFTEEEVEEFVFEIYQEVYMAAGLKAIAHTEALPLPDEVFGKEESAVMMPNPVTKYPTADPLNEMLGIRMPELSEEYGAKIGYYSIIAEIVAEAEYDFPDGATLVFRLSPETDADISGVYGAEFYKDWDISGTMTEVSKYQRMWVARGNVMAMDGSKYGFAVDAEGMSEELFYGIVRSFVEDCMNQRAAE